MKRNARGEDDGISTARWAEANRFGWQYGGQLNALWWAVVSLPFACFFACAARYKSTPLRSYSGGRWRRMPRFAPPPNHRPSTARKWCATIFYVALVRLSARWSPSVARPKTDKRERTDVVKRVIFTWFATVFRCVLKRVRKFWTISLFNVFLIWYRKIPTVEKNERITFLFSLHHLRF